MGMNLQTFMIKKFIKKTLIDHTFLAVISLDSSLKNDENYYVQLFLKECKYIEEKLIRHIIVVLESSSDDSDDFDEEYIKALINVS